MGGGVVSGDGYTIPADAVVETSGESEPATERRDPPELDIPGDCDACNGWHPDGECPGERGHRIDVLDTIANVITTHRGRMDDPNWLTHIEVADLLLQAFLGAQSQAKRTLDAVVPSGSSQGGSDAE